MARMNRMSMIVKNVVRQSGNGWLVELEKYWDEVLKVEGGK